MNRLLALAQCIRENFECNCTDEHGTEVDPVECPCGGDGAGPGHSDAGCWHCQAQAAIDEATGRHAPQQRPRKERDDDIVR